MSDLKKLTKRIIEFRDARDWKQFHNYKDLAIALQSEATEVLDEFKWKSEKEVKDHALINKQKVADELADVLYWVLLMAHDMDVDLIESFDRKMSENEAKYPQDKVKGRHEKYTHYRKK